MCEVRIIYIEDEKGYRVDVSGFQNQIITVSKAGDDANSLAQRWSKLTGWDIVEYTERAKIVKSLEKMVPGGSSGNRNGKS